MLKNKININENELKVVLTNIYKYMCMNMYSGQIKIIHVFTFVLAIIEIVYGLLVTIIHILFK